VLLAIVTFGLVGPSNYLRGIIESDRALARTSRLKGLKWTYQRTFAGDALVLTDRVESARDWLKEQDFKPTQKMFWDVNRADISAKGEFGYTAGAWTLVDGHTYTNGDFVRVWKKEGKDWKLAFEADTTTDLPRVPTGQVAVPQVPKTQTKTKTKTKTKRKAPPESLPTEDVQQTLSGIESKLASAGSVPDAYFLRPALPPSIGYSDDLSTEETKPADERFIVDRAADLACSFGYLDSEAGRSPFLRMWRRAAEKGWQVTLEYVGKLQPALNKQDDSEKTKD
jgi:hypothetical protein